MNKKIKRLLSLLLVFAMTLGFATSAITTTKVKADEEGIIWYISQGNKVPGEGSRYPLNTLVLNPVGGMPEFGVRASGKWTGGPIIPSELASLRKDVINVIAEQDTVFPEDCGSAFEGFKGMVEFRFDKMDTSNVKNMENMFRDATYLDTVYLYGINTSKVENMSNMFLNCENLTQICVEDWMESIDDPDYRTGKCDWCIADLTSLDLSNVKRMDSMFSNDGSKESPTMITKINLKGVNLSSLENMEYFCGECSGISIVDMDGCKISNKLQNMIGAFYQNSSLYELRINEIDTSGVTSMSKLFEGCSSITSLPTEKLDTSSCQDFSFMFDGCTNLKMLDLTGFDTGELTKIEHMFAECTSLETIYAKQDIYDNLNISDGDKDCFVNVNKLSAEGLDGTKCIAGVGDDATTENGSYAVIPSRENPHGYLTFKDSPKIPVQIYKTSKEDGTPVEGAEYTVYLEKECKTALGTLTTGSDGKTEEFDKFTEYDTVYVKETKTPAGYKLDKNVYTVKFDVTLSDTEEKITPTSLTKTGKIYQDRTDRDESKLIDGDITTFMDGEPAGQLVTANLGDDYAITKINYYPRPGSGGGDLYARRLMGVKFEVIDEKNRSRAVHVHGNSYDEQWYSYNVSKIKSNKVVVTSNPNVREQDYNYGIQMGELEIYGHEISCDYGDAEYVDGKLLLSLEDEPKMEEAVILPNSYKSTALSDEEAITNSVKKGSLNKTLSECEEGYYVRLVSDIDLGNPRFDDDELNNEIDSTKFTGTPSALDIAGHELSVNKVKLDADTALMDTSGDATGIIISAQGNVKAEYNAEGAIPLYASSDYSYDEISVSKGYHLLDIRFSRGCFTFNPKAENLSKVDNIKAGFGTYIKVLADNEIVREKALLILANENASTAGLDINFEDLAGVSNKGAVVLKDQKDTKK